MKIFPLLFILLFPIILPAQDPSFQDRLLGLDSAFVAYAGNDSPGAALGIYKDGELVYRKGYGMANLEYDIPIRPNTIFHVASVSKQFTSFAILLLEKEGKLSIDDDIRKYLPEIHDFGKTISIRHLMSHTSGFRDQWSLLAISGWRLDDVITKEQIYRLLKQQRELNFDPGEEYLYSNSGYFLMARIVEAVSGMEFDEYLKEHVFEPLGMKDTHVHDDHEMIVPGRAYSYHQTPEGYKKSVLSFANDGATSLFTTVEDLVKWMDNMFTGELGGEELVKKLSARSQLNSGEFIDYGLGQNNSVVRGYEAIGHGGSDAGFRSMIEWYPETHSGFVVFFNTGNIDQQVLDAVRAALLKEKESEASESILPTIQLSKNEYQEFEGTYVMNDFLKVSTQVTDTAFLFKTPFGNAELEAHDAHVFSATVAGARVYLHFNEESPVLRLRTPGANYRLFKVGDTGDTKLGKLEWYTGRYFNEETGTYYTVEAQDSTLQITHQRTGSSRMTPLGSDMFSTENWWLDIIRFVHRGNRVTGFLLGNGRVRDLKFIKVK